MTNTQNIVRLSSDSVYFTSRLDCTIENEKPLKIGFKKEYIQFTKNCKIIDRDGDICWLDCTEDSKIILYKQFSKREDALFTGSDTDFPLVQSKLELPFAVDSQYDLLFELHIPNEFKARFGTNNEKISHLRVDNEKISLYGYSRGAGMEYKTDKNVYFFTIPKGKHDCNLNMIFTPNHRMLLRSSVPWIQTLFLFILWLVFPAMIYTIQNNIEYVRLFFSATYGGYILSLTRSKAPYLSCLENHWIGFLFILVTIFATLVWIYPSPTLIFGIVISFVALSLLNFALLLIFYFTGYYPEKLIKLYRYPNKIYNFVYKLAISATNFFNRR